MKKIVNAIWQEIKVWCNFFIYCVPFAVVLILVSCVVFQLINNIDHRAWEGYLNYIVYNTGNILGQIIYVVLLSLPTILFFYALFSIRGSMARIAKTLENKK